MEKENKELEENKLTSSILDEKNLELIDELSEEEKRELKIKSLKEANIRFKNSVHDGNITRTKFGDNYKQKRKNRNKMAKASRKANRR